MGAVSVMPLGISDDDLNVCVACGLCLPHCPTFRATGEESLSPRGRIDAMRSVQAGASIDDQFVRFMATCVQCRGCEPACPSGVPYGRLIETTRHHLKEIGATTPWWQRLGFRFLQHHRLVLAGSTMLAALQRVRAVPLRVGLARLPLRRGPRVADTATLDDVEAWLFTGCVMDAWFRPTHRSTARVLDALGVKYRTPGPGAGCCGALHVHAGLTDEARRLVESVIAAMPGDAPILINSAGCGAQLKEVGHLLGTEQAELFARRVFDIHEWIAERADDLPLRRLERTVIVQDPCHLRHVQRADAPVRDLLRRIVNVVELDDDGLCCGAGGAYSALQPDLASQIRDRKLGSIDRALARSAATVVASANPGCSMHLQPALAERSVTTVHPIDLIAEALP